MTKTQTIAETIRGLAGSTIFHVKFVKRTNGEIRDMVCRLGVAKDLTGEGMKYDPIDKGLLTVYDMQKRAYRSVPLDSIINISIRGEYYDLQHRIGAHEEESE